ncbi:hypothetical protein HPB47_005732 [Ixodes persulcatus]|uniref:Uncharacterized protein n=1 Tax=Ixodes persulcatus TaxID=34615 RepID=A0AC60PC47_IXOPE|nr:hypothetical protein HPB47_005732 [Ixodes persulcatus]
MAPGCWRGDLNEVELQMLEYGESLGLVPYAETPSKGPSEEDAQAVLDESPSPTPDSDSCRLTTTAWRQVVSRRRENRKVGWTKRDPAVTTERKSTPVATNRHSSGTEQHLDMDEEGRRRSERNRTRQTGGGPSPTSSNRCDWNKEHEPRR